MTRLAPLITSGRPVLNMSDLSPIDTDLDERLQGIPLLIADELDPIYPVDMTWKNLDAPVRPPFPELWVEAVLTDDTGNGLPPASVAWYIAETDTNTVLIWPLSHLPRIGIATSLRYNILKLDDDGFITDAYVAYDTTDEKLNRYMQSTPGAGTVENFPLSVLAFLNCKNVETIDGPGTPRTREQQKAGRPGLRYQTITIDGKTSGGGKGRKTGTAALHMVRGHFKTYTEDAPLFGKLTGTYWTRPHLAGNPANGTVVSDYKVKA